MGHLKRSSTTKHLLRKTTAGAKHLASSCGSTCPCPTIACASSNKCTRCRCGTTTDNKTPTQWTVTFTGNTLTGDCCGDEEGPVSGRTTGNFNGTYTLTQDGTNFCKWVYSGAGVLTHENFDTVADCSGDPDEVLTGIRIELSLNTFLNWVLQVMVTAAGSGVIPFTGITAGTDNSGGQVCCTRSLSFTDQTNVTDCPAAGGGGIATATPC